MEEYEHFSDMIRFRFFKDLFVYHVQNRLLEARTKTGKIINILQGSGG